LAWKNARNTVAPAAREGLSNDEKGFAGPRKGVKQKREAVGQWRRRAAERDRIDGVDIGGLRAAGRTTGASRRKSAQECRAAVAQHL